MHSNLTAADVAKYWGCKVKCSSCQQPELEYYFGYLTMQYMTLCAATNPVISFVTSISDCHLLLKPLSEISEDDAVEVAKIANIGKYEAKEFIGCGKDNLKTIGYYIVGEFINSTYSELRMNTDTYIAIIDYLR
jgi:hypothetical protein